MPKREKTMGCSNYAGLFSYAGLNGSYFPGNLRGKNRNNQM